MKRIYLKMLSIVMAAALLTSLCACRGKISPEPIPTDPNYTNSAVSEDAQPPFIPLEGEPISVGELYGSFLTMYRGYKPTQQLDLPYMKVFDTYQQISDYYDETYTDYLYGVRFISAMASFSDEFLAENDVMIIVLNEPSSYVNHTAEPIVITDAEVNVNITRHIPENAPLNSTQYHLIFIAPNGGFDAVSGKELDLHISEVIDPENNSAFDAERFRLYYPEFISGGEFCYRADSLDGDPSIAVDIIDGYEELALFYDTYKSSFDLDSNFAEYIGTLYNWGICQRYIILATVIPCADEVKPRATELFVNNLEIYMKIKANQPNEGEDPKACYLLITAVERSDLQGVNLGALNLQIE